MTTDKIQDAYIVAAVRTPVGKRRVACSKPCVPTTCWPMY